MKQRELGKTGLQVSEIAFGGVEIGLPYGIGVHSEADMLPRQEAVKLLHTALEKGINFFDTARLYGQSEQIMGDAFHDRRGKVVICTKCTHFKEPDGSIPGLPVLKHRIEASLHESLGFLRTDYVDIFMLHQADMAILSNEDVAKIFDALKASGKVRAIGASTYTTAETKAAIDGGWEVVQLAFNLMDQRQAVHFDEAKQKGVGLVIRSVLLKGLLSDKGRALHPALRQVEQHIGKYHELLTGEVRELSTLATRFALTFDQVSSVLVGIDRIDYLDKALLSVSGSFLNGPDMEKARALAYPDPAFIDLPGWDRKGWLT